MRPRPGRTALLVTAGLLVTALPHASAGPSAATDGPVPWITAGAAVHPVREGRTATVTLTVTTADGTPLDRPVTVGHTAAGGTATAGADYAPATGTVTFPAGTPSGARRAVRLRTVRDPRPEVAETVRLRLRATGAAVPATGPLVVIDAHGLPYLDTRLPVHRRVRDLLGRMTLAEKIGQMTQAERRALRTPGDIATHHLGSLLSGGGSAPSPNTPRAWARMVDGFQLRTRATRLQIPLLYGVDAVHGHNNVTGTVIMPHNIGLGAARDPRLAERTAAVTATETRATGVPWTFAPCLCVTRDERWGRSYESFGEDPALVTALTSVVRGLQGAPDGRDLDRPDKVLATAKHYVGDGGTAYGSSSTDGYTIDQGVTRVRRAELEAVHLAPYRRAVRRGVGSVMPSYSSVDLLGDRAGPVKMHAHAELISRVLKGRMGFRGFTVSDWQAIDQLPGDYADDVRTSVNAGLDMIMVPNAYRTFQRTLRAEVAAARVSTARIDDAVSRILTQKFRLGLFERPYADTSRLPDVGSAGHRAVAREAAAASQVLLKNAGGLLPLKPTQKVYVAGSNADDLGHQAGGWTISWQGSSGDITRGTTVLDAMRRAAPGAAITYSEDASRPVRGHDVGVVVVGEAPYAEGVGDVGNGHDLALSAADRAAVDRVCAALRCAVLVVSGRPQLIGDRLGAIDALVASWLPGTEGDGVADVLYGRRPFTGRLPVSWPRSAAQLPINVGDRDYDPQFPFGWGLTTPHPAPAGDGAARLRSLAAAAAATERAGQARSARGDRIAGAARAVVQARVGTRLTPAVARPFAEADHLLLTGDLTGAVARLTDAYRAAR
ncbi:glycoside hydrolase family 3 protein [Streptomyces pactum]|nr:glycoside hydrolase family 3 protein [Streptomyces pactum]